MTHPGSTVSRALALAGEGYSAAEIARLTGCHRSTVRTWLRGQVPKATAGCVACGRSHDPALAATGDYVQLLGVYLGDGCISEHPRGVHRLRIQLDAKYPALIEECRSLLAAVAPRNRIGRSFRAPGGLPNSGATTCVQLSVYATWWPCLFPQHGSGRKHERAIVLAPWQRELVAVHPERLLRGLIHSDGCRFINSGRNWSNPRYSFSNRSADIRGIFCDACDALGLRWTLAPHTVYISRKADVARLDEWVGPKS